MSAQLPQPDRFRSARRPKIVLVDPVGVRWAPALADALENQGFTCTVVARPEEIRTSCELSRRPLAVVYSPSPSAAAEQTLAAVAHRPDPAVMVVVDESDFSHYYRLMSLGVRGYFTIGEGVERIAAAVALLAGDAEELPRPPASARRKVIAMPAA